MRRIDRKRAQSSRHACALSTLMHAELCGCSRGPLSNGIEEGKHSLCQFSNLCCPRKTLPSALDEFCKEYEALVRENPKPNPGSCARSADEQLASRSKRES